MPPPRDRRRPGSRVQLRAADIDYKNLELLRRFTTDRGKILPRKTTRIRARNQRLIAQAIKRARHLALLPYCSHHT